MALDSNAEHEEIIAELLRRDILLVNSNWWEKDWSEEQRDTFALAVICNDFFAYACADAEGVAPSQLDDLWKMHLQDPDSGHLAWCVKRRKMKPLSAYHASLSKHWDLDALVLGEEKLPKPTVV
jgi:hypothetical protein